MKSGALAPYSWRRVPEDPSASAQRLNQNQLVTTVPPHLYMIFLTTLRARRVHNGHNPTNFKPDRTTLQTSSPSRRLVNQRCIGNVGLQLASTQAQQVAEHLSGPADMQPPGLPFFSGRSRSLTAVRCRSRVTIHSTPMVPHAHRH